LFDEYPEFNMNNILDINILISFKRTLFSIIDTKYDSQFEIKETCDIFDNIITCCKKDILKYQLQKLKIESLKDLIGYSIHKRDINSFKTILYTLININILSRRNILNIPNLKSLTKDYIKKQITDDMFPNMVNLDDMANDIFPQFVEIFFEYQLIKSFDEVISRKLASKIEINEEYEIIFKKVFERYFTLEIFSRSSNFSISFKNKMLKDGSLIIHRSSRNYMKKTQTQFEWTK
jgi:hypothetical protein